MITLLHGDNVVASRLELDRIVGSSKSKEIRRVDGRGLDETSLTQAVQSQSLFGGDALVVVEHLFGKLGRKTTLIAKLAAVITISAEHNDIILWEDKEVGKTVIGSLGPTAKILVFQTPKILFTLLDGLKPGNPKQLLSWYQLLVQSEAPELIFSLLVRRVRHLMMICDGVSPKELAGWQATRLTSQAKFFTMEKLLAMHRYLLAIDTSTKSGTSAYDLQTHLELFLLDL